MIDTKVIDDGHFEVHGGHGPYFVHYSAKGQGASTFMPRGDWGADGPEIGAHDSTFFWLVRWIIYSVEPKKYNTEQNYRQARWWRSVRT